MIDEPRPISPAPCCPTELVLVEVRGELETPLSIVVATSPLACENGHRARQVTERTCPITSFGNIHMGGVDSSRYAGNRMTREVEGPVRAGDKHDGAGIFTSDCADQMAGPGLPLVHRHRARSERKCRSILRDPHEWHGVIRQRIVRFVEDVIQDRRLITPRRRELLP
jgi:hypothetical protein